MYLRSPGLGGKESAMQLIKEKNSSRIYSFILGGLMMVIFSLGLLLFPKQVAAQGTSCLTRAGFGGVTIDSIEHIYGQYTTTTDSIQVEVFFTPSNGDLSYWGNLTDRQYTIEATRSDNSRVSVVPSAASNGTTAGQLRLLFYLPGSTFTQLVDDQQTGYALNLKSPWRQGCLIGSYTALREDNAPPPIICEAKTEGQCGSTSGCAQNEMCVTAGSNFECKRVPDKCGFLSCGKIGSLSGGDSCGCAGGSFSQMPSLTNYCCGWIVNGACSDKKATICGDPYTVNACGAAGKCAKETEQCTRLGCQEIDGVCGYNAAGLSCGDAGTLEGCGSRGGCSSSSQVCTPSGCASVVGKCGVTSPPPQCGDPGTLNQCGSAGGCPRSDLVCQDSCLSISGKCGVAGDPPDTSPGATTSPSESGSLLDAVKGPTNKTFDALNPLNIAAGLKGEPSKSPYFRTFSTPGGIISRLLLFAFPIAGIVLFLMIVWGGFEMVTGATNAKSMDAGKQRITAAVVGFLLLFVSYWLMQLIELVFGLSIL
jgi:hypothetical protein